MSRFYASIQGSRGEATRQGHGNISGHVRGWSLGVRVEGRPKPLDDERDCFSVYATGGSHGAFSDFRIGVLQHKQDGSVALTLSEELAEMLGVEYRSAELHAPRVAAQC